METILTPKNEIQDRLRRRFLDRLAVRIKKMRKSLVDRDWPVLKTECRQIKDSGDNFGFEELTELAVRAERTIPDGERSRARHLPEAHRAVAELILAIDTVLITHSIKGVD